MIDHENRIFDAVSEALRTAFDPIFITGVELVNTPPQFPAVSIVQKNTEVNTRYSTFDRVENVTSEEYEFGVFSNLERSRDAKEQTKAIVSVIDGVMANLYYPRTFQFLDTLNHS